uniref:Ctr_41_N conopeptide n=1 Tax=Conus tribblei TaxID=101761 RepID=A0A0C9R704_CONTD
MSKSGMLLFVLLLVLPLAFPKLVPVQRSLARRYGDLAAKRDVATDCVSPSTPNLQGPWQNKKCCLTKRCGPTNCCVSSSCTCSGSTCYCPGR